MTDRILVHYALRLPPEADPQARADAIAREQTVELPRGGYPPELEDSVVGRVERVEEAEAGQWRVTISYDPFVAGDDLPQLVNLLYGNVSMLTDVAITDVELPDAVLESFEGPLHGLAGLRDITGVSDRPIIVGTIKPMGLSVARLADLCGQLASAGIDIIKDDHGLTNQHTAPFEERVARCQEVVVATNLERSGSTQYFPNVTADPGEMHRRAEYARAHECRGVLVSPGLTGLPALNSLAGLDLAVVAHPSGTGAFLRGHGLPPRILYGTLMRLAGADGVIYTNAGGRFPLDETDCEDINAQARAALGQIKPSLPIAGGGVDASRMEYWIERYGIDVGFLVGSSLYTQPALHAAARELMDAVEKASNLV